MGDSEQKEKSQFQKVMTLEKEAEAERDNAKRFRKENEENKRNLEDTLKMIEAY